MIEIQFERLHTMKSLKGCLTVLKNNSNLLLRKTSEVITRGEKYLIINK
jgi:hypothetical protein